MYKSKLKKVSEVDAGGYVEILFEIYIDNELAYPNMRTICFPSQIEDKIKEAMQGIKEKREYVETIPENLEVII